MAGYTVTRYFQMIGFASQCLQQCYSFTLHILYWHYSNLKVLFAYYIIQLALLTAELGRFRIANKNMEA